MKQWLRGHVRRPSGGTMLVLVVIALAVTGIAFAAIPDQKGVIHSCYKKAGGQLRVVNSSKSCTAKEKALAWNQKGRRGPRGFKGDKGDKGDTGDTGPRGPSNVLLTMGNDSCPAGGCNSGAFNTMVSRSLTAGKYLILGKGMVTTTQPQSSDAIVRTECKLVVSTLLTDTTLDTALQDVSIHTATSPPHTATLNTQGTFSASGHGPTTVKVQCTMLGTKWDGQGASVALIKVDSIG